MRICCVFIQIQGASQQFQLLPTDRIQSLPLTVLSVHLGALLKPNSNENQGLVSSKVLLDSDKLSSFPAAQVFACRIEKLYPQVTCGCPWFFFNQKHLYEKLEFLSYSDARVSPVSAFMCTSQNVINLNIEKENGQTIYRRQSVTISPRK